MSDTPPPRLITPYRWAKEAGCSKQAVSQRIHSGSLPTVTQQKPDGTPQVYIDATQHPPIAKPAGRQPRGPKY